MIPRSGLAGKRWDGWHFKDGKLVTPLGDKLTAATIESQQEQIQQTRSVYRQASKVREHAKSGLADAGMQWYGWKFQGGFLESPDGRKIGPHELYAVMVGHDAMMLAKQRGYQTAESHDTDVIALQTK